LELQQSGRSKFKRTSAPNAARQKFLRLFPRGFYDEKYLAWERDYKWKAHRQWQEQLGVPVLHALLKEKDYQEIARRAVTIEARTNLIFSFEKMALRDAVRTGPGAKAFSKALFKFLHGSGTAERRFSQWSGAIQALPRPGTRIHTWPVATVFGFMAQPKLHFFLKPIVTKKAAEKYGFSFHYEPRPAWTTYASALAFATTVGRHLQDLRPRDMIDLQSFIWVLGSNEYD
jgi:hypothetical protein